ncbi:hypothetical protein OIO90_006473 [Microbotryomycetes sp. JL221]|nr:hypothetical protein OIO90_006473 [Microbotryomycetes sp. JL221]
MLTRSILRATPRSTIIRSYATAGAQPQEPINIQRGPSKTPIFIVGALCLLYGGYRLVVTEPPSPIAPAVHGMQHATHPKTEAAKKAAGLEQDPLERPPNPGGDFKARKSSES